jgi:tRNA(Ile)-lysidine synthase
MIDQFIANIRLKQLFQLKEPVLLAASGGIDSTVMTHLFHHSSFRFGLVHANFRLRGKDSDDDEQFVFALAASFNVPFFSTRFDTADYAEQFKISIQMAARELRYKWMENIRKENGYHFIATAHHQDDQVETVLLNMFRGTGIQGLHGMVPKQNRVIRPMLSFAKSEIIQYALANKIAYREDRTNAEAHYDRNKIRLEIIPAIEKHYPAFQKTFAANIERWKEADAVYSHAMIRFKKKFLIQKGTDYFISIPMLINSAFSKTLIYELLKEFNFTNDVSGQVFNALGTTSGKWFYSETHRLLLDRKQLIISARESAEFPEALITSEMKTFKSASLDLKMETVDAKGFSIRGDHTVSCLDFNLLEFPLLLRRWKRGDYFYPLGMKRKKKKISDYLIDRKIPLNVKENTWVLESGKRIACIIGERIDERFKITLQTQQVFVIRKK